MIQLNDEQAHSRQHPNLTSYISESQRNQDSRPPMRGTVTHYPIHPIIPTYRKEGSRSHVCRAKEGSFSCLLWLVVYTILGQLIPIDADRNHPCQHHSWTLKGALSLICLATASIASTYILAKHYLNLGSGKELSCFGSPIYRICGRLSPGPILFNAATSSSFTSP